MFTLFMLKDLSYLYPLSFIRYPLRATVSMPSCRLFDIVASHFKNTRAMVRPKKSNKQRISRLQTAAGSNETTPDKPIRIRRHRFAFLRKNEDFLTMIRVGRLLNSLAFCLRCIDDFNDDKSPVGRRQYMRALFLLGGFLHEGLDLVASLRSRYKDEPTVAGLVDLTYGSDSSFERKMLQLMRHNAAFHLDSHDQSTREAMKNLKLPRYDLASYNSQKQLDFYFNFADTIDLNFLIDKLKGDKTEQETLEAIFSSLMTVAKAFMELGHKFLARLAEKTDISDHLD